MSPRPQAGPQPFRDLVGHRDLVRLFADASQIHIRDQYLLRVCAG
jgi:hypothetical protein